MKVTVKTVSVDDDNVLIDCDKCGPMGLWEHPKVGITVYEHLEIVHNCDMSNIDIERIDP